MSNSSLRYVSRAIGMTQKALNSFEHRGRDGGVFVGGKCHVVWDTCLVVRLVIDLLAWHVIRHVRKLCEAFSKEFSDLLFMQLMLIFESNARHRLLISERPFIWIQQILREFQRPSYKEIAFAPPDPQNVNQKSWSWRDRYLETGYNMIKSWPGRDRYLVPRCDVIDIWP